MIVENDHADKQYAQVLVLLSIQYRLSDNFPVEIRYRIFQHPAAFDVGVFLKISVCRMTMTSGARLA